MTTVTPGYERAETSLESVVLVPIVFLVVFMCFHLAALTHQGHVAMAVAVRGAEISGSSGNLDEARERAVSEMRQMANELGSRLSGTPGISYSSSSVIVTVEVMVSGAVPFLPRTVRATARQTLERFVLEQERE